MLQPKRTKFRKMMKGRNRGLSHRGSNVDFGEFGLKAISRGRLTARQIEAARRAMTRRVKRGGKIWIRVFPDKPITGSLLRFVRVRVRVTLSTGLPRFSRVVLCLRSKALTKHSRARPLALLLLSCLSTRHSLNGR